MITKLSERTQKILRAILLIGFVLVWVAVALSSHGPRAFWTGFFPILPAAIVLLGFHSWRVVCPLAQFNRLGARIPRSKQRRVGPFLEKYSYLVSLGALALGLTIRLLFINGDGLALGIFLACISLAAFVVGVIYTGKTWCNFFCPVGIVEKIYTEPANLYAHGNSQCPKCTACKKHCPDIDEENHYWKELESPARRGAYYAFPGLVWGFYTAFALPHGTIHDYFSGAWTRVPHQYALATSPGLFFANVPRWIAMPAHLVLCMALSFGVFNAVESIVKKRTTEAQRARHLTLTLAAFTAFTSFYVFAGQPTYRRVDGLPLLAALFTTCVATLFLVRRWNRAEESYVQERSVKKILAKWTYAEAPPKDPREVFAFVKSKERERDKVLAVYADTIHEVLSDGVVEQSEQRLLEKLRNEFGITKAEHDKVMARLSAEDRALFEPGRATSIEQVTQERGYRIALQNLLPTRPSDAQLESLRRSYGIDRTVHDKILAELRSGDSPLRARALEQLDQIDSFRTVLARIAMLTRVRAFQLLALVLLRRQASAVRRVVEFVGVVRGDESRTPAIDSRLDADDVNARREGLTQLAVLDGEIARRLEAAVLQRRPEADPKPDTDALAISLVAMLSEPDAMLAAAATTALAVTFPAVLQSHLTALASHAHPLVRESAAIAMSLAQPVNKPALEALAGDRDSRVRATAASLVATAGRASMAPGIARETSPNQASQVLATRRDANALIDAADFASLPTPERMLVLASIALFADLEPEQLYDIAVLATERTLAAGDDLCREGEPGAEVFVVIAGEGEIFTGAGETQHTIGRTRAGDCVGELAVLDEAPRSATVRATSELRVLAIQGHAFRDLLGRQPDLANAVIAMITRRLRDATVRASNAPR